MAESIVIDGLDERTALRLRHEAQRLGLASGALVREIIRERFGVPGQCAKRQDDLDHLAGTWSQEEYDDFCRAVADFERVDEGLWK